MNKKRSTILLILTALALTFSANITAQDEAASPPPLSDVWVLVPKAGHDAELEAGIKAHTAARKAAGDPRAWHIYTMALGEGSSPYVARFCCFDWADQDTYIEWFQGTDLLAHFNEHVNPHVASVEHHFSYIDWDNSHWPAETEWSYVGVTTWTPKPGEGLARSKALKKMTQTAKEKGWDRNWVFMNTIGGPSDLSVVVPFANYADMAPPEQTFYEFMVENLGQEEAEQMFHAFSNSFWGSEYTVWQLRHDLSTPIDED